MKKYYDSKSAPSDEMAGTVIGGNGMLNSPEGEKTSAPEGGPCFVVGIGASAGGHEALEQIFTTMPTDCGLAFVVVMHLPPDGPSFMAEMLGRYTTMAVATAEDGMHLLPDRVHVIPAGRNLAVSGGRLHLEEPGTAHGAFHPIDRLFRSLAEEVGERAVAVVLSGSGSDGAQGAKLVKEAGGIVIVQEPGSAAYPAMPRSAIAGGAADLVLTSEEIPAKIAEIARGQCILSSRACRVTTLDEDLVTIFSIVKASTGHDFSSYKNNTVMRRIERRMAVNDAAGIGRYIALLRESSQEAHALCQDILIGVTSFFRDPEAFAVLRRDVIPRLFANRSPDEPVRLWHACCASGEEVYSVAMLIREYLAEQKLNATALIFATDIDEVAVAQARSGLYGDDIEEDVGSERLKTFFTRNDGRWQVTKQLREMIVFAHHSLIKDPPFSRLDLLVCRNFLIYLNPDMQKRLIALFHQVLKPGGVLFLGSSETVGRNSELFTTIDKKWKLFERRKGKRQLDAHFPFNASLRKLPGTGRLPRPTEAVEADPGAIAAKLLMERYSPPCVVVNEKYEVVHVSSLIRRFLEVPLGEPTRDILRMAREELRPALRAAIYKVFAEQQKVDFRGVKFVDDGTEVTVNVVVEPLNAPQAAGKLAVVIFEQAAVQLSQSASSGANELINGEEASGNMLVRQLEEQLRITHEQLQATSEQLESSHEGFMSANEELMSINEEFQAANEELQSTNEELETSKEELQALNEELVTVNAELQSKVEELNQANSDMENLLTSSGIATLFLDRQLHIKGFTPAVADIFNLIRSDIGRPFRHFAGKIDWSTLAQDVETVLAGQPFAEREAASLDRERCYLKRIFPYRTQEGNIDGIVITFIDITERKQSEEARARLAAIVESSDDAIIAKDLNGVILNWNAGAERLFGYRADEIVGKPIALLIPSEMHGEEDRILQRLLAGERIDHFETMRLSRDGRRIDVSITVSPIKNAGRIIGASKIVRDITERKQAVEAMLRTKEEWERTFNSVPDLIAIMDNQHRIIRVNQAMAQRLGMSAEQCIGQICYQAVHGTDHHPAFCPHSMTIADGRDHEIEVHEDRLDGDFLVSTTPLLNEHGQMIGSIHIARDITARKRAEEALRESEERVRLKLESILSPEGDIGNLELADIIDSKAIQSLMDDFYKLVPMPMAIIDLKGKVLVGKGWQDICTQFHRVYPETYGNCIDSDLQLTAGIPPGEFKLYKCKNNLWDVATPIMVGGRHLGNLFSGQFFFNEEPLDYELFKSQAKRYGFNEDDYIAALVRVPLLSRESLAAGMEYFIKFADLISKLSYSNIKLARSLGERDALMAALHESEKRLQLFIEHAPAALAMFDTEMRYLSVSRRWLSDYGLENRDLRGLSHYEVFPEIPEYWKEAHRRGLEGEVLGAETDRFERADGSVQWVRWEIRPWYDSAVNVGGIVVFSEDITARQLAEEALRQSEERYRMLFNTLIEGFCIIDVLFDADNRPIDYRFLEINPAFETQTGLRNAQGKLMRELAPDHEAHWFEIYGKVALTGKSARFVNEAKALNRWYDVSAYRVGGRDSHKVAILFSDITEVKRADDALKKLNEELQIRVTERTDELAATIENLQVEIAERLRAMEALREKEQLLIQQSRQAAMGEMIGNIAHQWRQPLNALGLTVQILLLNYDLGEFSREFLDHSVNSSMELIQHMSRTIDDFRNYFKPEKEKVEFKVSEAITNTLSLIEDSFKMQQISNKVVAKDDPVIFGYRNEFAQALLNILNNARDALTEREIDDPRVTITICTEDGSAVVTIADNAGGIPEEIMGKVFDPYFTTKGPQQGTGVGLFMSKTIIEKNMGGKISVRNIADGAEFRIEVRYGIEI